MKKKINSLIKLGDYAQAYDLSRETLNTSFDNDGLKLFLQHRSVLCLIRCRALDQAQREYFNYDLNLVTDNEDVIALGGKLFKEFSEYTDGEKRVNYRTLARNKYAEAYQQSSGYFSGINYATLSLLLDDILAAHNIADQILNSLNTTLITNDYYMKATISEAHLLLGDIHNAKLILSDAINSEPENFSAHASTIKQFALILDHLNQNRAWLDEFRPPKTIQYTGHIFHDEHIQNKDIHEIKRKLSKIIKEENIGFGYGALAAGSDIIFAEQLLENNCELHLILPVAEEIFVAHSITPYGNEWYSRYKYCRDKAKSVHVVFENLDYIDHLAIMQANEKAMGMALLKAQILQTSAKQIVICDVKRNKANNLTAICYDHWKKHISDDQAILQFPSSLTLPSKQKSPSPQQIPNNRAFMATIFVDIHDYSKLKESQLETFLSHILTPLANFCENHFPKAGFLNTWGDGLFLAFEDIQIAARFTLELQNLFKSIDLKALNFPESFSLRIGCHYGIVYIGQDPFLKRANIFGADVSLAARIEPVTPPGSIYVSSNFACQLAVMDSANFRCEYIGKVVLEKTLSDTPLFSLKSNDL